MHRRCSLKITHDPYKEETSIKDSEPQQHMTISSDADGQNMCIGAKHVYIKETENLSSENVNY